MSRPIEKRIRISSIRTIRTPSASRSSTGSPSPVAAIPATALSAPHGQVGPARTRSCSCSANHRTGSRWPPACSSTGRTSPTCPLRSPRSPIGPASTAARCRTWSPTSPTGSNPAATTPPTWASPSRASTSPAKATTPCPGTGWLISSTARASRCTRPARTHPAGQVHPHPRAPGAGLGAAHARVGHHPRRGYRPHRPGRRAQRARDDAPTTAPRRTRVVARLTLLVKQGSR